MDKAKVLIADDEPVIRDLFVRVLSKQGYEVFTAGDGLEALNKIRKNNFDMLILDLRMPKVGGMELLRKAKELKKDLITIVITGYATLDTAKGAIKQGCFDYITKPFDIGKVNAIIKRAFEMRRFAEDKKKFEEQLQMAERLTLVARMGAGVAHEVNTVLTAVKLFLEMLNHKKLLQGREGENIRLILEEVTRAERLIIRFLAFTKPAEAEFIKTDINKVIRKSLQFLMYKFDRQKIEVIDELSENMTKALCDPAKMEEVFLNIFSNSIDAMPDGGHLIVKIESAESKVIVTVADTGVGIPLEDIFQVYTPFFTTKPQGTGLGLSIVHRIIDEHKGTISITSKKGKGTTVRIELPIR